MEIQLESYSPKRGHGTRYFWLAIIVVMAAVGADWWERKRITNLRSLSLEEQETILAAVDRTAIQHRLTKERVRRLRSRVTNPTMPVFIDQGLGTSALMNWESQVLTISPKFFEADPITQENSLLALAPPAAPFSETGQRRP